MFFSSMYNLVTAVLIGVVAYQMYTRNKNELVIAGSDTSLLNVIKHSIKTEPILATLLIVCTGLLLITA